MRKKQSRRVCAIAVIKKDRSRYEMRDGDQAHQQNDGGKHHLEEAEAPLSVAKLCGGVPHCRLLFRASADLLPGAAVRRGPNLRAPGRELNHRAIAKLRTGRAPDVKHKDDVCNIPADANRTTRVKRDRATAARQSIIHAGPAIVDELGANSSLTWQSSRSPGQKCRKPGDEELFLGGERVCVASR